MQNYSFSVLWSDEDGEYVATSAEFPGLSGLGATPEEAIAELKDAIEVAIQAYLEDGEPVPSARRLNRYSGQPRLRLPKSLHAAAAARAEAEAKMSNDTTQHTPADVREQAAMEVYVWEHVRRGAEESWARQQWQTETDGMRDLYFEAADRILDALSILTARGEDGGDSTDCPTCGDELAVYWEEGRIRGVVSLDQPARAALLSTPRGEGESARRDEAQEEKEDALDLIRWAESHHAALEPVAGNIMPPGTYACYAGDADDPYMGPGILGAIRAARRGEGGGE